MNLFNKIQTRRPSRKSKRYVKLKYSFFDCPFNYNLACFSLASGGIQFFYKYYYDLLITVTLTECDLQVGIDF